jgi:PAS domain S-box-containing protein
LGGQARENLHTLFTTFLFGMAPQDDGVISIPRLDSLVTATYVHGAHPPREEARTSPAERNDRANEFDINACRAKRRQRHTPVLTFFRKLSERDPIMKKLWLDIVDEFRQLGIREKTYAIYGLFAVLIALLIFTSIHSVRLQTAFREDLATSASSALNIERVNGLIYAIVMESRGIYMSTERAKVKQYGDSLLKRNRELASVVGEWQTAVRTDDAEQFAILRKRINQFISFRNELVRRAIEIDPAAGREWGDNDANRSVRTALNEDLETLSKIYAGRTRHAAQLGERSQAASWQLIVLGSGALLLAALVALAIRNSIIAPLLEITHATNRIVAGKLKLSIPHIRRLDEIGRLARAVQNFQDAVCRNMDLQELELATARERDAALGERDDLDDKYHAKKWQLDAAINNMAQGLIMLDSKTNVLVVNNQYREMYGLSPEASMPGCSLKDIVKHRAKIGLFSGDVDDYVAKIQARIVQRKPSVTDIELADGRIVRVSERSMAGGGWVATHEDFTEQRRVQRILERTEKLLATVIESVPEAIVAKDARSLRYVFVNRAAESLYGMSRIDIMGKTARDIFPEETAELIERHDKQLLVENREIEVGVHTISTPGNGKRVVSVRRPPIADQDGDSHFLLSMIQDQTDQVQVAA